MFAFIASAHRAPVARAEGTVDIGVTQALRAGTDLWVDILGAEERIVWTGAGTVAVFAPSGAAVVTASSGQTITPTEGVGAYRLRVGTQQNVGSSWDVRVVNAIDSRGRLHSYNWQFNAGSFAQSAATNGSFYALVQSGGGTGTSVIELKLAGLAGFVYDINANASGVTGSNAGRSVPESGSSSAPMYRMYLRVPSLATFEAASPGVFGLDYVGGIDTDVFGAAMTPCDQVLPGESQGYFYFTSVTEGSFHLQCDLDRDGSYEIASGDDLLLIGAATIGTNVVAWDGLHGGIAVAAGSYTCRARVTVGEFHYVGRDIETSYPGMRMFEVHADGGRTGLSMFWNDELVQSAEVLMPNGQRGLVGSEGDISSGVYGAAPVANANARSWGDFSGNGKGNVSFLDTFVWLDAASSSEVFVRSADASDTDGDGLTDFQESCLVGSLVAVADTDGDGIEDGSQYAVPESTAFSGLESNGRLASALARRAVRRLRMSEAPGDVARHVSALSDPLYGYIPESLASAAAIFDGPQDLVDITNAELVAGADYVDIDGSRIAGALIVTTRGALYEHQKAICDRVSGATLRDVRPVRLNGVTLFATVLTSSANGRLEHGVSLQFVEDPSETMLEPISMWLREDAPAVLPGVRTLTVQAWGRTHETAMSLARAIVARIERDTPIAWPAPHEPRGDETYSSGPNPSPIERREPSGPTILVESARTFGGQLTLTHRRRANGGSASLRVVALEEDGVTERVIELALVTGPTSTRTVTVLDPFLDATVDVLDDGRVVDRVWLTDGAYAAFDASIWNGTPAVIDFTRTGCEVRDVRAADAISALGIDTSDAARLSGCARVHTRDVVGFSGVARHLTRALDLGAYGTMAYHIVTDQPYEVCAEGDGARSCVDMPAASGGRWEAIPTTAFQGIDAELLSFASTERRGLTMEVSGLALLHASADTRQATTSCAASRPNDAPASAPWACLLVALWWVRKRRLPNRDAGQCRFGSVQ